MIHAWTQIALLSCIYTIQGTNPGPFQTQAEILPLNRWVVRTYIRPLLACIPSPTNMYFNLKLIFSHTFLRGYETFLTAHSQNSIEPAEIPVKLTSIQFWLTCIMSITSRQLKYQGAINVFGTKIRETPLQSQLRQFELWM